MHHTMVTYTVKAGREEENAALVRAMFEELAQTRPAGLRFRGIRFVLPDARAGPVLADGDRPIRIRRVQVGRQSRSRTGSMSTPRRS